MPIVLPLAFIFGGVAVFLFEATKTGDPDLDSLRIRGNALLALASTFGLKLTKPIARGYLAILHNEAAYREADPRYADRQYPRGRAGYYPVGDVTARLGPAVGPGQILSGLHLARLGYTGDPLDLARVGNEYAALSYSARIYAEALEASKGDVLGAIRRYNGSGVQAEAYKARAMTFAESLGWDLG